MSVVPDHLEIAGVGEFGTLHWAAFHRGDGRLDRLASCVATESEGGYLAATLVRPGLVAGVTRSRIDWLRGGSGKFAPRRRPGSRSPRPSPAWRTRGPES